MTGDPSRAEPRYTTGPLRWRAPVGRHRHAGQARAGRWLAALATAVVVVSAGGAVASTELSADERFREFVVTAEVGEWVSGNGFRVSVQSVRAAALISTEPGVGLDTAGVWVLARVRAVSEREAVWIDYGVVRDSGGRTWSATERIAQPLVDGGYRLDPRIPVEAELAFEVPPDAATDLTIRLAQGATSLYGMQLVTVVEVPLPVDEPMVAAGLAATEPAGIDRPEIVIGDPPVAGGGAEAGR